MNKKKTSYLLVLGFLCFAMLFACNDDQQQKKIQLSSESRSPLTKLTTQAEFLPGFWMSDAYLKKIEQTKSIYVNRFPSAAFYGFIIGKPNQEIDSFLLKPFPSSEDEVDALLEFDRQKNVFKGLTKMHNKQEKFELYPLTQDHIKMYFSDLKKTDDYRKVLDENTELRRILFEGTYFTKDKQMSYTFDRNGKVKGLGDYVFYEVIYDFAGGINFDGLLLYRTTGGGVKSDADLFKYVFKKGVLTLTYVEADWILEKYHVTDTSVTMIKI